MNKRVERVKSIFDSDDSDDEYDKLSPNFDDDDEDDNNLRQTITEVCNSLGRENNQSDKNNDAIDGEQIEDTKSNSPMKPNIIDDKNIDFLSDKNDQLFECSNDSNISIPKKSILTSSYSEALVTSEILFDKLKQDEIANMLPTTTNVDKVEHDEIANVLPTTTNVDKVEHVTSDKEDSDEVMEDFSYVSDLQNVSKLADQSNLEEEELIPKIDSSSSNLLDDLKDTGNNISDSINEKVELDEVAENGSVHESENTSKEEFSLSNEDVNESSKEIDSENSDENLSKPDIQEQEYNVSNEPKENDIVEEIDKSSFQENIFEDNYCEKKESNINDNHLDDSQSSLESNPTSINLENEGVEKSHEVEINKLSHNADNSSMELDDIEDITSKATGNLSQEMLESENSDKNSLVYQNIAEEEVQRNQSSTGSLLVTEDNNENLNSVPKISHKDKQIEEALGKSGDIPWTALDEDTGNGSNNESDATSGLEDAIKSKNSISSSSFKAAKDFECMDASKSPSFSNASETNRNLNSGTDQTKELVIQPKNSIAEELAESQKDEMEFSNTNENVDNSIKNNVPISNESKLALTDIPVNKVESPVSKENIASPSVSCNDAISPIEEMEMLADESFSSLKSQKQKRVRVEDVFTDSEGENNLVENKDSISAPGESGAKKIKRKRLRATSINLPAIMLAFEKGWVREIVYRTPVGSVTHQKKADVYYYTPSNKKLRSRVEIEQYLMKHNITDLTLQNFSFFKEPLGVEERFEKVRTATNLKTNESDGFNLLTLSKKRKLEENDNDSPVAKKTMHLEKRVMLSELLAKSPKTPKVISQPMRTMKMNTNVAVYATHLFPCNPALTQPRILTPAIHGYSSDKAFHCTPLCSSGNVPNLQCVKCLCFFHSECCQMPASALPLILSSLAKFLCPNCYGQERETAKVMEFQPAPCYEPLAFYPSSDSEDEGLGFASDFEHPSYNKVSLRPPTPEEFTQQLNRNTSFVHSNSSTNGENFVGEENSLNTTSSSNAPSQFYFVKPPQMNMTSPPPNGAAHSLVLPPQTHFHSSRFKEPPVTSPDKTPSQPMPLVRREEHLVGDLCKMYSIFRNIFLYLEPQDLLNVSRVCQMWRDIALSSFMWKSVKLTKVSDWDKMAKFLNKMGTTCVDLRELEVPEEWQVEEKSIVKEEEVVDVIEENKTVSDVQKIDNVESEIVTQGTSTAEVDDSMVNIDNQMEEDDKKIDGDSSLEEDVLMTSALSEHDYIGKQDSGSATESQSSSSQQITSPSKPKENKDQELHKAIDSEELNDESSCSESQQPSKEVLKPLLYSWTKIGSFLKKIETLEKVLLGPCETKVLEIVLFSLPNLTSISSLNLIADADVAKTVSFDPSSLMRARKMKELRLGSQNCFSFKCNFNFIKLPQLKVLKFKGLKIAETGWPYMGTQLTHLYLGCVNTFNHSTWLNISSMTNLEELAIEGNGCDYDSDICSVITKLPKLNCLKLLDWNVGPKLPLTLKRLNNIHNFHIIPSVEGQNLRGVNGGRLMVMLESTKHLTEFVWGIQPSTIVEEETEKIYIQSMKLAKETDAVGGDEVRAVGIDSLKGYIKCRIPKTKVIVRKVGGDLLRSMNACDD